MNIPFTPEEIVKHEATIKKLELVAQEGYDIEKETACKIGDMIEMLVKIRRNHIRRKVIFGAMQTALKKGEVKKAADLYHFEMPKSLKVNW